MHYLKFGAAEGREPHPLFDTNRYVQLNRYAIVSGATPLEHFLASGGAGEAMARERQENLSRVKMSWQRLPDGVLTLLARFNANRHQNLPRVKRSRQRSVNLTLALLARFSINRNVRDLSSASRLLFVAMVRVGAVTQARSRRSAVWLLVKGILFRPEMAVDHSIFDEKFVAQKLVGASCGEPLDLLWRWLRSGAEIPTTPFFDPEAVAEGGVSVCSVAGESPFQTFLLEGLWEKINAWPSFDEVLTLPYVSLQRKEGRIAHEIPYLVMMPLLYPRKADRLSEPSSLRYYRYRAQREKSDVRTLLLALGQKKLHIAARLRSGTLGEMVQKAAALDPLVLSPAHARKAVFPPFAQAGYLTMRGLRDVFKVLGWRRYENVVVIPHCRLSGAARVAGELSHALATAFGAENVLVLRTELPDFEHADWFPEDVMTADISAVTKQMMAPENRVRFLFHILRGVGAQRIFNVNSALMWSVVKQFGGNLSDSSSLYAYLFCSDRNDRDIEVGYPVDSFCQTFDVLKGVFTDSTHLASTLIERFLIDGQAARKIEVLPTPVRNLPAHPTEFESEPQRVRPQVFWGGRFDRQKRFELVIELAERMPDIDFLVWGRSVLGGGPKMFSLPHNIHFQGEYSNFSDLPLGKCSAWLYTSHWDGVPTILLDVIAHGIPLVATSVGGTADVLDKRYCAAIPVKDGAASYEAALRQMLSDLPEARRRALALRDRILADRSPDQFTDRLCSALNIEDRCECLISA